MDSRIIVLAVLLLIGVAPGTAGAVVLAQSTFTGGLEGWTVEAEHRDPNYWWDSSGRMAGRDVHNTGRWQFVGSSAFSGDMSDAYGGTFSFDYLPTRVDTGGWLIGERDPYVRFQRSYGGIGYQLYYTLPKPEVYNGWNHYEFAIEAGDFYTNQGVQASEAHMRDFFAHLGEVRIEGHTELYAGGWNTTYLDNVAMSSDRPSPVPEPTSVAVLGLFLSVGVCWRRRCSPEGADALCSHSAPKTHPHR